MENGNDNLEITEEQDISEGPVKVKKKSRIFTQRNAIILIIVLLVTAVFTWTYGYLTHGDPRALSSQTFWLTQRPIVQDGYYSNEISPSSIEAIRLAAENNFIIKLTVSTEGDDVAVICDEPYPLSEALDEIGGKAGVVLRIQVNSGQTPQRAAEAVYRSIENYAGNVAVESYDVEVLRWFKESAEHIIRGLVSGDMGYLELGAVKQIMHENMMLNYIGRPHYIAYDYSAFPNWAVKRLRKDMVIIATGVDTMEDMQKAFDCADNVEIKFDVIYSVFKAE